MVSRKRRRSRRHSRFHRGPAGKKREFSAFTPATARRGNEHRDYYPYHFIVSCQLSVSAAVIDSRALSAFRSTHFSTLRIIGDEVVSIPKTAPDFSEGLSSSANGGIR